MYSVTHSVSQPTIVDKLDWTSLYKAIIQSVQITLDFITILVKVYFCVAVYKYYFL